MSIRVTGDFAKRLLGELKQLGDDLRNAGNGGEIAQALVVPVGEFEAKQNDQSFASEGAKSGAPWAELSPEYRAQKRKDVGPKKILQYTGEMRKSLVTSSHPDRIARLNGNKLEFGSRHERVSKHQHGGYFTEQVPASVRRRARQIGQGRNAAGQFTQRQYLNRSLPGGVTGRGVAAPGYVHVRAYTKRYNLPARPPVRKSATQWRELKHHCAREILILLERRSSGQLRRILNHAQRNMRRADPRL